MILAVLIISLAFGTVTEFQIFSIQLCPAAYCAAMSCLSRRYDFHFPFKFLLPLYLLRRIPLVVAGHSKEYQDIDVYKRQLLFWEVLPTMLAVDLNVARNIMFVSKTENILLR